MRGTHTTNEELEFQIVTYDGQPFLLPQDAHAARIPLRRVQTIRRKNTDGSFRLYNTYDARLEQGTIVQLVPADGSEPSLVRLIKSTNIVVMLPLLTTEADGAFNREENLRAIPKADADYERLHGHRANGEGVNSSAKRDLNDWGRAHSYGHARQFLDLIAHAILRNTLARIYDRNRRAQLAGSDHNSGSQPTGAHVTGSDEAVADQNDEILQPESGTVPPRRGTRTADPPGNRRRADSP